MLHVISSVFAIILILHTVNGSSVKYPDVPNSVEEYRSSEFIDSDEDFLIDINSDENTVVYNEYPHAQLERIAQETMELLESDDEEGKRKLKFGPDDYYLYVPMRIVGPKVRKSKTLVRIMGEDRPSDDNDGCPAIRTITNFTFLADIFGRGYWICNTESLEQIVEEYKCVDEGNSCGKQHAMVFNHYRKCTQQFAKVELFGIPDGKKLVKENQELNRFVIHSGCACTLERIP